MDRRQFLQLVEAAKFAIEDIVFLRVASSRVPGMIVGIIVRGSGQLMYEVQFEDRFTCHYEIELSDEYVPDFGDNE